METVIGASSDIIKTLKDRLVLDFKRQPGQYIEDNNESAKRNMTAVREKVDEWVAGVMQKF